MHDVAVLTPSYGYREFLGDAVSSVLGQVGAKVHHIVQDGGSQDGTIELLKGYGKSVDWRSAPDQGQSDALNKALEQAKSRWVGWLNADEFYLPSGIGHLLAIADQTKADVVYGDVVFVDKAGAFLRLVPQHPFDEKTLRTYGPFISNCATLFRREVLGGRPWDARLRRIMDWDLYLGLASQGAHFAYVPLPIGAFRVHENRVTARPLADFAIEYEILSERYRLHLSRWNRSLGRVRHGMRKMTNGAYQRQFKADALRGADFRWFRPDVGADGVSALVSRCYGDGA